MQRVTFGAGPMDIYTIFNNKNFITVGGQISYFFLSYFPFVH